MVLMVSIDRTAYPSFKRNPVARESVSAHTPYDAEIAFIGTQARQPILIAEVRLRLEASSAPFQAPHHTTVVQNALSGDRALAVMAGCVALRAFVRASGRPAGQARM